MKLSTFLLFVVLAVPSLSFAQYGGRDYHDRDRRNDETSALSIYAENGDQFFIVLNGINQNNTPTSKIRIDDLPKYDNDVQVVFADNRTPAIRKRVNIADPVDGKAVQMTLKIVRGRDGNPHLKFHKCIEVDRNYHPERDEYVMYYGQPSRTVYEQDPPPPPAPMPMDGRTFEEAKNTISRASFNDTKLSTAKTILASNYVTTNQVMEICKLFSFDDTKLEFAKYAYDKTVDRNNYFKVGNVFSFSSSKEALNNFISGGH
jgi:hypothetical protein